MASEQHQRALFMSCPPRTQRKLWRWSHEQEAAHGEFRALPTFLHPSRPTLGCQLCFLFTVKSSLRQNSPGPRGVHEEHPKRSPFKRYLRRRQARLSLESRRPVRSAGFDGAQTVGVFSLNYLA